MEKTARIFVAGEKGLVGSAVVRRLQREGFQNLLSRTRVELDLTCQEAVECFFELERPEYVFMAAAKVGGIWANSHQPAEFIYENLAVQTNMIHAAHRKGVKKLLFLGSSCIYPKYAPQPMREEDLLTSSLEPTNQWYAIAKIAGLMMAQAYWQQYGMRSISLMPTNLYGPGDKFDLESSHVIPALMRKFHEAKCRKARDVIVWGSGTPRREFMHVDDLADACLFLMNHHEDPAIVNVGSGDEVSIAELAELIRQAVGFDGAIVFDASKPDGSPRKLLDSSKLRSLGWQPRIPLRDGLSETYRWYTEMLRQKEGSAV